MGNPEPSEKVKSAQVGRGPKVKRYMFWGFSYSYRNGSKGLNPSKKWEMEITTLRVRISNNKAIV